MNKNILLLVEGAKTETKFYGKMVELILKEYGDDFIIWPFETNIYELYRKVKNDEFLDVKSSLIESSKKYKGELGNKKFAYIYLIFDLDAHDVRTMDKRSLEEIFNENVIKAREMVEYFDNETIENKGKLYINYPMMESYKFTNPKTFFDSSYKDETITLSEAKKFKSYVNERKKNFNVHISDLTVDNIKNLIIQNIFKLNQLENNKWAMIDTYEEFKGASSGTKIIDAQQKFIDKGKLSILNTSLFMVVDYFGGNTSFYSDLKIKCEQ